MAGVRTPVAELHAAGAALAKQVLDIKGGLHCVVQGRMENTALARSDGRDLALRKGEGIAHELIKHLGRNHDRRRQKIVGVL